MLNKATIIGRLGRDPEFHKTSSGVSVCNFNVATNDSYVSENGKTDNTEWHSIVVFQKQAENCKQYLKKGSLVYVEGPLKTRTWTSTSGTERSLTEIRAYKVIFLDKKEQYRPKNQQLPEENSASTLKLEMDDDIPF